MTKVRGVKLQIAIYKITENSTSNVVNKQKVEVWGAENGLEENEPLLPMREKGE